MARIRSSRLFTAALYSYKVLKCFEVVLGVPLKCNAVQLSMVQFIAYVAVPQCAEQCFKVGVPSSAVPLSECSIIAQV